MEPIEIWNVFSCIKHDTDDWTHYCNGNNRNNLQRGEWRSLVLSENFDTVWANAVELVDDPNSGIYRVSSNRNISSNLQLRKEEQIEMITFHCDPANDPDSIFNHAKTIIKKIDNPTEFFEPTIFYKSKEVEENDFPRYLYKCRFGKSLQFFKFIHTPMMTRCQKDKIIQHDSTVANWILLKSIEFDEFHGNNRYRYSSSDDDTSDSDSDYRPPKIKKRKQYNATISDRLNNIEIEQSRIVDDLKEKESKISKTAYEEFLNFERNIIKTASTKIAQIETDTEKTARTIFMQFSKNIDYITENKFQEFIKGLDVEELKREKLEKNIYTKFVRDINESANSFKNICITFLVLIFIFVLLLNHRVFHLEEKIFNLYTTIYHILEYAYTWKFLNV